MKLRTLAEMLNEQNDLHQAILNATNNSFEIMGKISCVFGELNANTSEACYIYGWLNDCLHESEWVTMSNILVTETRIALIQLREDNQ